VQADWTLTHTSHKDTEQSTIEASITLNGVTVTDPLFRLSPNEWPWVYREIPVSADKMFWTSNKPVKWTPCISIFNCLSTFWFWFINFAEVSEYVVELGILLWRLEQEIWAESSFCHISEVEAGSSRSLGLVASRCGNALNWLLTDRIANVRCKGEELYSNLTNWQLRNLC
jgi:hypothetical protein